MTRRRTAFRKRANLAYTEEAFEFVENAYQNALSALDDVGAAAAALEMALSGSDSDYDDAGDAFMALRDAEGVLDSAEGYLSEASAALISLRETMSLDD